MTRHTINRAEAHPGHRQVTGGLARAAVFGMSDGLMSNVLLVLGFAGSGVNASVVRLAGLAGAIAGAISMAAGEWISISAQNELVQREVDVERRELTANPASELQELAVMYESHGMEPATAATAAADVMRDHGRALAVHAREELGVDPDDLPSAMRASVLSFACFIVGALLPVLPWFAGSGTAATVASVVLGVAGTAVLGWTIGRSAERNPSRSALRQVAIMLVACAVTYTIGRVLDVHVS